MAAMGRATAGVSVVRLGQVGIGDGQLGFERGGDRADQRDRLQIAYRLVLEVDVRHPAVQRGRIGRLDSGGDTRAQAQHEGIGVAAAAVKLQSQIEPLLAHRREESLQLGGITLRACHVVDAAAGRHDNDAIHQPWPARQKVAVPALAQQHDLSRRIRGA